MSYLISSMPARLRRGRSWFPAPARNSNWTRTHNFIAGDVEVRRVQWPGQLADLQVARSLLNCGIRVQVCDLLLGDGLRQNVVRFGGPFAGVLRQLRHWIEIDPVARKGQAFWYSLDELAVRQLQNHLLGLIGARGFEPPTS